MTISVPDRTGNYGPEVPEPTPPDVAGRVAVVQLTKYAVSQYDTVAPYPGDEYIGVTGSDFSLVFDAGGLFTLEPAGCVLTYIGADCEALAWMSQTTVPNVPSGERTYGTAIALNDDLLGLATFGDVPTSAGMQGEEYGGVLAEAPVTCQRPLTLTSGDTVRPVLSKEVVDSCNLLLGGLHVVRSDREVYMKRLLELLGFRTTNEQGHELGCLCAACMAAREKREPFKPGTVGCHAARDAAQASRALELRFCAHGRGKGKATMKPKPVVPKPLTRPNPNGFGPRIKVGPLVVLTTAHHAHIVPRAPLPPPTTQARSQVRGPANPGAVGVLHHAESATPAGTVTEVVRAAGSMPAAGAPPIAAQPGTSTVHIGPRNPSNVMTQVHAPRGVGMQPTAVAAVQGPIEEFGLGVRRFLQIREEQDPNAPVVAESVQTADGAPVAPVRRVLDVPGSAVPEAGGR
jgi:hypothetical protein